VNTKRSYLVRRQSRHIEKHHVLHDSIFAFLMMTNFRYSLILVFFSVPMPASIVSSTFYPSSIYHELSFFYRQGVEVQVGKQYTR